MFNAITTAEAMIGANADKRKVILSCSQGNK